MINMISTMVFPTDPTFIEFLNTRGIHTTDKDPKVIHYFGTKSKEVELLMKIHKSDLILIHRTLDQMPNEYTYYNFVVDILNSKEDILDNHQVQTNNVSLCQIYYQRLGLNRTIVPIVRPEPKPKKSLRISMEKIMQYFFWR